MDTPKIKRNIQCFRNQAANEPDEERAALLEAAADKRQRGLDRLRALISIDHSTLDAGQSLALGDTINELFDRLLDD